MAASGATLGCAAADPDSDQVDGGDVRERSADEEPLTEEPTVVPCGASGPDLLTLAWVDTKAEALIQDGDDAERTVAVTDVALSVRNDSPFVLDGEVWVRVVGGGQARELAIAAVTLGPEEQETIKLDPTLLESEDAKPFMVAGSLSARVEFSMARQTAQGEVYEQREAQGSELIAWRPLGPGQVAVMTQTYADKAASEGAEWIDPAVTASLTSLRSTEAQGVVVHVWQYAVELDEVPGSDEAQQVVP